MIVEVKSYNHHWMAHDCRDGNGAIRRIDLLVNGDFEKDMDPEDLVGKRVEINSVHPFIEIAHGVKIVSETKEK